MRLPQFLIMMYGDEGLPQEGLAEFWPIENNLVGTIGILSITLTTGTIANLAEATWPFPSDAVTLQVDSDLGGDVLFDSANAMASFVRSGAEWYALFNVDFAWIGFHATRGGVVFYSQTMAAKANQIQNYLGRYYPVEYFGPTWEEPGTWDDNKIWSEV